MQNFTPINQKLIIPYVFECFQSHFHILEELHEFLCMRGVLIIFEKEISYLNSVSYGLVTKSFGARVFFSILWGGWINDHLQEDLAKFG